MDHSYLPPNIVGFLEEENILLVLDRSSALV